MIKRTIGILIFLLAIKLCFAQSTDTTKTGTFKIIKDSVIPTLDCSIKILFNNVYKTGGQLKKSIFLNCTMLTVSDSRYSVYSYDFSCLGNGCTLAGGKIYGSGIDAVKSYLPNIYIFFFEDIIIKDSEGNLYYPCKNGFKLTLVSG